MNAVAVWVALVALGVGAAAGVEIAEAAGAAAGETSAVPVWLEDFDGPLAWTAHPADGVALTLRTDSGFSGNAMRMDFEFSGGGWAIARREVALDLPENFEFRFRIKGDTKPNHLEFKLVDETGENVWWHVRRDHEFPAEWETITIKKRHISFAWGPKGGGEADRVAAIEIVVTAGQGGRGSVWIDDLELRALLPPSANPPKPRARASSAQGGHDAERVLDGKRETLWSPRKDDPEPWIDLDAGTVVEFGGLALEWEPELHAREYDVLLSDDGTEWRPVRSVTGGNGGRDRLFLPESEARFVRVALRNDESSDDLALAELGLLPLALGATREAFFGAIAADAPRGTYPRGISGEQTYWTVVGPERDPRECLLGEDGALETGRGRFSIEPFLFVKQDLVTWANVRTGHSLEDRYLPIPTVSWDAGAWSLDVTAFDGGMRDSSAVIARYTITNRGPGRASARLFLALRPFQVNPPSQSLNLRGGTAPIRTIALDAEGAIIDGRRAVLCLDAAEDAGAATFDAGDMVADHLRAGVLPASVEANDAFAAGSGAFAYTFDLESGASRSIALAIPLDEGFRPPSRPGDVAAWAEAEHARARDAWRARVGRVELELPSSAQPWVDLLRAQIGYILVNRAGPAIQPGARSYARSWIRDGSLTSSALLRVGLDDVVREFIEWYAPHQFENGKIPCVVDARGADPVPEHDSSGELIFLVAEYLRFTRDVEFARGMWPRVERAAAYLDSLRLSTRTASPDSAHFDGILPPSISHEGYSAKPMHSYWDDFFALRGFRDAAYLAQELGLREEGTRWAEVERSFSTSLGASIRTSMSRHGIDYVPGCADLGDFDATSTTIALSPCGADAPSGSGRRVLPVGALERTFERYWTSFSDRRDGRASWDAYTPYEIRNVGAFVRLGWRDRAHELLEFFAGHERPPGWNQWPEVIAHDERAPHFLGDLPHTWVGSDYIRSFLDCFAYPRGDNRLVVGAGIPESWLEEGPVVVRGLRTQFGTLDMSIRREAGKHVVELSGTAAPPGGIDVSLPGGGTVGLKLPATVSVPATPSRARHPASE